MFIRSIALFAALVVSMAASAAESSAGGTGADSGFLTARLVTNATFIATFFRQYEGLTVTEIGTRKQKAISAVNPGVRLLGPAQTTLAFGARLPPGQYKLTQLTAAAGSMSMQADVEDALPPFEIVAGQVTDLGVLVVQPAGGGKGLILQAGDVESTDVVMRRHFPTDAASFAGKAITPWHAVEQWAKAPFQNGDWNTTGLGLVADALVSATESKPNRAKLQTWAQIATLPDALRQARAATAVLNDPAPAADGTTYFGSTLGQVLRRAPDGTWQNIDTGLIAEISAVAAPVDAAIIVGTEYGEILQQTESSGGFSPVAAVPDGGRISDIRHVSSGEWIVASRRFKEGKAETNVYVMPALAQMPASPAKTLIQPTYGFWKMATLFASTAATAKSYFVSVPGQEVDQYDFETRKWTQTVGKQAPRVLANNGGTMLFTTNPAGHSVDGGHTWIPAKLGGYAYTIEYFNPTEAAAVVLYSHTLNRRESLMITTDAGKSWTEGAELPKDGCLPDMVRAHDAQKRMICISRFGSIYSAAAGQAWVEERMTVQ